MGGLPYARSAALVRDLRSPRSTIPACKGLPL